jgi:hypothetical protein
MGKRSTASEVNGVRETEPGDCMALVHKVLLVVVVVVVVVLLLGTDRLLEYRMHGVETARSAAGLPSRALPMAFIAARGILG